MNSNTKNITIKSIAQELGISFSTVSKALNDDSLVKDKTKKRVLEKALELGYSPNMHARALRSKTTKTIGIILNDIENPSLSFITKQISIQMAKYGYTTLICDSQYDPEIERKNILSVLSRTPDSIFISPVSSATNLLLLSEMADKVVVLGDRFAQLKSNYVHVDYVYGGYISAIHMLNNGHRQCLIIAEPETLPISHQIIAGIQKAYDEYNLQLDTDMIIHCASSVENGFKAVMNLWDSDTKKFKHPFTGIITFCDSLAYGVYKASSLLGFRLPEDISVIGFDDYQLSAFSMPALSTINISKEMIAARCCEILTSKLVENEVGTSFYSIEPTLVSRDSVKKLV